MVKVTILGAAGGIGQPLSLLVRLNPKVSELSLFDIVNATGVATDLSHIPTKQEIHGYIPKSRKDVSQLQAALQDANIVVIPAGVARKPGMTRNDLFKINASIVRGLVHQAGVICPDAFICVISNPVNSTVPIAAEELKSLGVYNPAKLFGVTTLDNLRLEKFLSIAVAQATGKKIDPVDLRGDVVSIGGHSGQTIVPLLNAWAKNLSTEQYEALIHRVQYGGDEVVKAKKGHGSATLSMAAAGYRFVSSLAEALSDGTPVDEVAFIDITTLPGNVPKDIKSQVTYLSVPFTLSKNGVEYIKFPTNLTSKEVKLLRVAVEQLKPEISRGYKFVNRPKL